MADRSLINSAMGGWQPGSAGVTIQSAMGGGQPDGPPGINLNALGLSLSYFTIGTPATINILYATNGSSITAGFLPTGFTLNSGARTIAYDGTGTAGNPTIQLTETLATATRSTTIGVSVVSSSGVPSITGFQAGYNMDGMNYFIPGGLLTDWGKNVSVDDSGHIFIPPVKGTYQADVTPTTTTLSNFTSGITVTPVSGTPGRYTIVVADYPADNYEARGISYTGTKPTRLTVTKPGYSGRTSQEFLSGFQGKWLRNLDMDNANNVVVVGPDTVRPLPTDAFYPDFPTGSLVPYQVQVDAVADLKAARSDFVGLWDVLPCDLTDAAITARATYQRDTMPNNVLIALEFGNETFWNILFSGNIRMMVDGVRKGYYGNATETVQNAPITVPYNVGYIDSTNFASPAMSSGEYIAVNNLFQEGSCIFRALRNVAAGTKIIEGADFTKAFGYSDLIQAGRRWHSVRHNQIIEIYRTVFGETRFQSQIVPIIMGQQESGDYAADMVIQRTFVSGYFAKVKGMGCSFYFNDRGATAKTADAIGAAFRANMEPTRSQIAAKGAIVASYGKVFMAYEGMTHPDSGVYRSDPTYTSAWDTLFSSPAGQAIMADWAFYTKNLFNGPACGYMGMGHRPWTLRNNWEDSTNKRFVGWNQGLASGYLPADYQLKSLAFSSPLQVGTAVSGAIVNATEGSTIVCNVPGITINSTARTFTGTPTVEGTVANALVETLSGVTNSPRTTSVSVAPAAALGGYRYFEFTSYGLVQHPTNEPLTSTPSEYPSLSEWAMSTSGTPVDYSTVSTSGDQFSSGEGVMMLLDGNTTTFWTGKAGQTNVVVVDLGPGKAARPDSMTFTERTGFPERAIGDFMIRASNDGSTWTQIYRTIIRGGSTPGNAIFGNSGGGFSGAYVNHVFTFTPTYPA